MNGIVIRARRVPQLNSATGEATATEEDGRHHREFDADGRGGQTGASCDVLISPTSVAARAETATDGVAQPRSRPPCGGGRVSSRSSRSSRLRRCTGERESSAAISAGAAEDERRKGDAEPVGCFRASGISATVMASPLGTR